MVSVQMLLFPSRWKALSNDCLPYIMILGFGWRALDAFLPVLSGKIKSLQATAVHMCCHQIYTDVTVCNLVNISFDDAPERESSSLPPGYAELTGMEKSKQICGKQPAEAKELMASPAARKAECNALQERFSWNCQSRGQPAELVKCTFADE